MIIVIENNDQDRQRSWNAPPSIPPPRHSHHSSARSLRHRFHPPLLAQPLPPGSDPPSPPCHPHPQARPRGLWFSCSRSCYRTHDRNLLCSRWPLDLRRHWRHSICSAMDNSPLGMFSNCIVADSKKHLGKDPACPYPIYPDRKPTHGAGRDSHRDTDLHFFRRKNVSCSHCSSAPGRSHTLYLAEEVNHNPDACWLPARPNRRIAAYCSRRMVLCQSRDLRHARLAAPGLCHVRCDDWLCSSRYLRLDR